MTNRIRRPELQLFVFPLAFVLIGGCGEAFQSMQKGLQERRTSAIKTASQDTLRSGFEAANKLCPRKYDQYTTLVSIEMIDDQSVEYRYVISDSGKKFANRLDKRALREAWVEAMQGNPLAAAIAERDITIQHIYNDSRGGLIFAYEVNRAMLAGNSSVAGTLQRNPLVVTSVKNAVTKNAETSNSTSLSDFTTRGVKPATTDVSNPVLIKVEETLPKAVRLTPATKRSQTVQQNPYAVQTVDSQAAVGS